MTVTTVFPDPMNDLRYWLRNHPVLNPLHGGRVFFRLPKTMQAPMLRISRIGGGQQPDSEVPLSDLQVIIEIWGMHSGEHSPSDYPAVRQLLIAIEQVCWAVNSGTLMNPNGTSILMNARFNSGYDSPDPATGWPRMICHVLFTIIANGPMTLS
jgi:hypothetical protein